MKDIFFYYRKKSNENRKLVEEISEKYPHARFKIISGSVFKTISQFIKESKTDFCWVIELETLGWEELISYNVETWDKDYLHVFESKTAKAYLVPKTVTYNKKENDFPDKKFIKTDVIKSPPHDVFFICYDENNAAKNLRYVKEKRPDVKIINGVKGIFNAHREAALQSTTEFFWVVDADATVIDAFDFEYRVLEYDFDVVHIWKSYNPINKLEYGHGGVKLIPKHVILTADEDTTVDITTSLTDKIKVIDEISNINNFATNPFNTWRAAFRECVKLSASVIPRSDKDETAKYLETWTTVGNDRPFGDYAISGAIAGQFYGLTNNTSKDILRKINDYEWLITVFESCEKDRDHFLGFFKWRDSFVQCVELINEDVQDGVEEKLNDLRFNTRYDYLAEYGRAGASAGHWYGSTYKGDWEKVKSIYDYEWIKFEYEQHTQMFPPSGFKSQEETKSEVNGNTEAITEEQALATS